jgi:hypothetical protein
LTSYVEELRAELALKDEMAMSLRAEISATEASLRQKNLDSNSAPNSAPGSKASIAPSQPKPKPTVEVYFANLDSPLEVYGIYGKSSTTGEVHCQSDLHGQVHIFSLQFRLQKIQEDSLGCSSCLCLRD